MTSKDQRRRQLERQKADRQQQRRSDAETKRRRRALVIVAFIVAAMVLTSIVGLVTSLASDSDTSAATAPEQPATAPEPLPAGTCAYVDNAPDPSLVTDVGRPSAEPGDIGPVTATMTLNDEPVVMSLDGTAAPCTVGSWEFLSAADYFDDTVCHRLTTTPSLGVLQCGDPTGTGAGGPGYRFAEENLDGATYPAGTIAMANTGQPASTGSQFFIVHTDSQLPPSYTVVGTVADGLSTVTAIAQAGTVSGGTDGAPAAGAEVSDLVVERSAS